MFTKVALYNIDAAVKAIEEVTDNTMFSELRESITASIVNAVHSIVDWYERANQEHFSTNEDKMFHAFMYVNNELKHNEKLTFITYNVSGSMFPMFYPFRFGPPGVCWAEFKDNGSRNARGRRHHYEEMLMNKDVSSSLKLVRDIITKEQDQC